MGKYEFIDEVFEIAFGDDAINKGYTREEVLEKLREFSDDALKLGDAKTHLNDLVSYTHTHDDISPYRVRAAIEEAFEGEQHD